MINDNTHGQIKWLFLDLNSYFASVEQQENPALRGKPVAITPMNTESTCAIAASYEAKAYGIKTGTKIYEAKKLCPDLKCVLARHNIYVHYHHRIINEVINHIPINKIWSIDELSSRLPPRLRYVEAATETVRQLKESLRNNIGESVTCSVGLAPNSFLAKVATDMQKPNGLIVLEKNKLPGPLFDLKLTDFPGINVNMEARLNRANIYTVEQFWNTSPKQARHIWGSVGGERFWYNMHGYEIPDPQTNTVMIGHSRILDPELRSPEKARLIARRLTVKAATRLRRKEFHASRFRLSVRSADYHHWTAEIRTAPAQDNFTFLESLNDLWIAMLSDLSPDKLKKISISLHDLCRTKEITSDLFDRQSPAYQKLHQKNKNLSNVIDLINQRHGAETLQLGPTPKTRSGYVGTKIAFSRVPDLAEFDE